MTETTATPCFPIRVRGEINGQPTNAPVEPCYPRLTTHYNRAIKTIEVGFYGPEAGTIHLLTRAQAVHLTKLLLDAAKESAFSDLLEVAVRLEPDSPQFDNVGALLTKLTGLSDFHETVDPLVPVLAGPPESVFVGHEAEVIAVLEAEYSRTPRQAEGA